MVFAVATFCYNDIAADKEDYFTGGLAGILKKGEINVLRMTQGK